MSGAAVGRTVFLVDDDELILGLLRAAISARPEVQTIVEAATVTEGRTRLEDALPDVAIIDYQLPDGTGLELVAALRKKVPRCLIILVSGAPGRDLIDRSRSAGADTFLQKGQPTFLKACVAAAAGVGFPTEGEGP
jgi:two-component system, NarL family, response regulator DevR